MNSRQAILDRIKKATEGKLPLPLPVFTRSRPTNPSLVDGLRTEWDRVGGKSYRIPQGQGLDNTVGHILKERGIRRVVVRDSDLLTQLGLTLFLSNQGIEIASFSGLDGLNNADAGITAPDYGLADTGTLVEITPRSRLRAVSLVPPIHIAILPEARVLPHLDALWPLAHPFKKTHTITFITGPSRTADIEQILTIGVHGPKEAYLIIIP